MTMMMCVWWSRADFFLSTFLHFLFSSSLVFWRMVSVSSSFYELFRNINKTIIKRDSVDEEKKRAFNLTISKSGFDSSARAISFRTRCLHGKFSVIIFGNFGCGWAGEGWYFVLTRKSSSSPPPLNASAGRRMWISPGDFEARIIVEALRNQ